MTAPQPAYVIGTGGVALFFAQALEASGHPVVVCARRPLDKLVFESGGVMRRLNAPVVTSPDGLPPARLVVLATKAQDTSGAAPWLRRLCDAGTVLVVGQNGIDQADRVQAFAGGASVVPALVFAGIECIAPGHVRHHSGTAVEIPSSPAADYFADGFATGTLTVTRSADFLTSAWRKLMNNATANPLMALTLRRGVIFRDPEIQILARTILEEVVAVGQAEGAKLSALDVDHTLEFFSRIPGEGGTSMLYDRLAGRPLEHEFITGALVRAADRHGLAVPANRTILTLLRILSTGLAATGNASGSDPKAVSHRL